MIAGLPGTGISGIFYILLACWMLTCEIGLTLRGRSSVARWRTVGSICGIAFGMMAVIWIIGWVLVDLMPPPKMIWQLLPTHRSPASLVGLFGILTALAILMVVMLGIQLLAWLRRPKMTTIPKAPRM